MAARKKRKATKPRKPATRGLSRSQQTEKRKSNHGRKSASKRKPTSKPSAAKRSAKRRAGDHKRAARKQRATTRDRKQIARRGKRIRKDVERITRPKLKRSKQGGLREYQGPTFGRTKFGGYKEALKRVGEENQHAYDEAVQSLREGLDEGARELTIKRRRNKVRKLKRKQK